jgi:hypothetical protein
LEQTDFTPIRSKFTARRPFSGNMTFAIVIFAKNETKSMSHLEENITQLGPSLPILEEDFFQHRRGDGDSDFEGNGPIDTNYPVGTFSHYGVRPPQGRNPVAPTRVFNDTRGRRCLKSTKKPPQARGLRRQNG